MAKKITIDDLAKMIKNGFDNTITKAEFKNEAEKVNNRFDKVEKDLTIIKGQLVGVVYKSEFEKLESRVEYLENILDAPVKKR